MGKKQETDEFGIPIKKASTEVDEFGIPVKKKVKTAPSKSASMVSPTTAPSVSAGGTSGLETTPSVSQGIPSLPGRVNPQTLNPINQVPPVAQTAPQQTSIAKTAPSTGEYKPDLYTVDPNKANIGRTALGENLTVGEKDLGTITTYSGQKLGGQSTQYTQRVIAKKAEDEETKAISDFHDKVYAPKAKAQGKQLNNHQSDIDFYLEYLKQNNPEEFNYNAQKYAELQATVNDDIKSGEDKEDTAEDKLALERFQADLITKATALKTRANMGSYKMAENNIKNYYQDKLNTYTGLAKSLENEAAQFEKINEELNTYPKNEQGQIITDATNTKKVEELINSQKQILAKIQAEKSQLDQLQGDRDFSTAMATLDENQANYESVSARYKDLATKNPEAFKALPEYKALLERNIKAKAEKDYKENVLGVTSFGVEEGVGRAMTGLIKNLAFLPKSVTSNSEYGWTDKLSDVVSENIDDFNDEYIATPTEMDKPLLEDGRWNLKYLPGKVAQTATDMAIMVALTKGVGTGAGALTRGALSGELASSLGSVVSGYTMSAQGYYDEARQAGMNDKEAVSFSRGLAIQQALLELVSPNEKLLSPSIIKNDVKEFSKILAKGASGTQAAKQLARNVIKKNVPEISQELLQTLDEHIIKFSSAEMAKANENVRQSFGEEMVETAILTALTTTLLGGATGDFTGTKGKMQKQSLYMAAYAPDKTIQALNKMYANDQISESELNEMSTKIQMASQSLAKMGDKVPQEKKIEALWSQYEKDLLQEEAKKTDPVFQGPVNEQIAQKEEEIKQTLNTPSEAELLDENIAYLQELEKEGVIDDSQKAELKDLLTQKEKINVQEEKSQAEVLTEPVEETAPYVVDATEQRQPIELSVETPKVDPLKDVESTAKGLDLLDTKEIKNQLDIEANWDMTAEGDFLSGNDPALAYTQRQLPQWNRESKLGNIDPNSKLTFDIVRGEYGGVDQKDVATAKDENGVTIGVAKLNSEGGIEHIAVAPEFRGKGVADKLIKTLKQNNPNVDLSKTKLRSKGFEKSFGNKIISEAYHKAKADGSNPELVKAVEDLLIGKVEATAPEVKPTPKVETPTKKEEAKPEVKSVELEPRMPGGLPRKMEFKDGEWKLLSGDEYTRVAPAVQQQAQEAFEGVKTEFKKEEVNPVVTETDVTEVADPEVKAEVVPGVKKEDLTSINEKLKKPLGKKITIGGVEYKITDVGIGAGSPDITLVDKDGNTYYQETKTADGRTIKRLPTKSGLLSILKEEAKKETPQSNKQPVAKPTKVEKVADEKPVESINKNDLIDEEEEADNSKKEDKEILDKLDKDIEALKQTKEKDLVEKKVQGALYRAYKAKQEGKIKRTTYTAFRNTIQDVAGPKFDLNKSKALMHLSLMKDKVKTRLLGEGFKNVALSAPGINPKVVSDLIDAAFKIAEKSIDVGFTLKEAVDKAKRLIKANPNYKAAIRNKQIDEKEFDSKIDEAVNEETEALKKAYEEEQKKKAEVMAEEEETEQEALKTGEKAERKESQRQKESRKYKKIYDEINSEFEEYEKVSKENAIRFVNKKLGELDGETDALFNLANQIIEGNSPFSILTNPTATFALAEKMIKLAKDKSLPTPSRMAAKKMAGELLFNAAKQKTQIAQAMSLLDITAQLISTDESITMANIEAHMKEVYIKRASERAQKEVDEVADEINEYIREEYSPEELSKMKEDIREEILQEYAEKIFGKDVASKMSEAFDTMFIDLKDC